MKRSGEAEVNGKPDDIRHNGHTKARASGGARTGEGGAKRDSNPLAELAGTGQCGAGTDKSRMTSGTTRRRKSRMTSGRNNKKEKKLPARRWSRQEFR